jgi:hypothetical protein
MPKSLAELLAEVRRAIPAKGDPLDVHSTSPITDAVDLSTYRPLAPHEKAIIEVMLKQAGKKELAFLPQLEAMMVESGCTCGCPTISFAPPPEEQRIEFHGKNLVADMTGEAEEGQVGLILWQAGGKLTGLEVYDLTGREESTSFGLPRLETLVAWGQSPPIPE